MSLSRREWVHTLRRRGTGALSGAFIAARGLEAFVAEKGPAFGGTSRLSPPDRDEVRISSNENPLGPGAAVLEALIRDFEWVGRYPMNSRPADKDLMNTVAKAHKVEPKNIVLGAGSGELLWNGVRAFTSPTRALITAAPSFGNPAQTAELIGTPVKALPVDDELALDLDAMAGATKGAGLIFLCNPNNPTATVHSGDAITDFVKWVARASPDTAILIDEAYHDYVTDPTYRTSVPLAMEYPNVFVTRTFSKAHGMAGLRVGYAIGREEAIGALTRHRLTFNVNVLAVAAAIASMGDMDRIERERARNAEVRKFTREFFSEAGYESTDSQTNFIFVNLGRPAKDFREACAKHRVMVGRDFPPLEKTHVRISIGTAEEMRRATEVFSEVLGIAANPSPDQKRQ